MCVDYGLMGSIGVQVWWTCGGMTPDVGAAIAAASDEPMSMKLERAGESCSLIVQIQTLHQLMKRFVAASETCDGG